MQIDDKLITHLEQLSCLALSPDEKGRLAKDLGKIMADMARFETLNTDGVPEYGTPEWPVDDTQKCVNVFRDDEPGPSLARELLLKNTPDRNSTMIVAPGVQESERPSPKRAVKRVKERPCSV
ncbi:MAG: Asp-tRNA(Asn)/Glu-tRNA(Gln) amidotransferase subunit GatC [Treponema sp.]|nr:Asp-tRNA(Asn)/Glu-tRNA(Gln) amidotransferase subunit GatC [Treponema sp.]